MPPSFPLWYSLGDVGATALAESVEMLVMGMQELRVADVGMSTKAAVALGKALATNKRNGTSLRILDASDNAMGTVHQEEEERGGCKAGRGEGNKGPSRA